MLRNLAAMAIPSLENDAMETAAEALREAAALHAAGRLGEAERIYRGLLRQDGRNAPALHGLGLVAQQAAALEDAERLMRAAVEVDLLADVYRTNLGNVLQMQGRLGEAVGEYERALMLRPDSVAALSNLGAALLTLGRAEEAEARLRMAVEFLETQGRESAQVLDNLGNALQAQGRLEEAVSRHRRAVQMRPDRAEVHGNLGLALAGMGRLDAAMAALEAGIAREPGNARIQLARAQLQLLLGEFGEGLKNYEWRKRVHGERRLTGREWRGEQLAAGETLLLYTEQGLGDTVQCLRYLPWVRAWIGEGAGLVVEVQPPLRRLAEEVCERVVVAGEDFPGFAWHCSLMSLPLVCYLAGEAWILAEVRYLRVPEEARRKMSAVAGAEAPNNLNEFIGTTQVVPFHKTAQQGTRHRDAAKGRLRVGAVWSGNRGHVRDRFRSIPFSALGPLMRVAGVEFHSLQIGDGSESIAEIQNEGIARVEDMADTAALIERLDLVIGVDTAVVHLAGALGKAVWTMLPFWPDWRWGLEREDCAWYPTMRLFRQREPGDWAEVVERVRMALMEEVEGV